MKAFSTPYKNYFVPILKSLVRRGGAANIKDVYEDLLACMHFNEHDIKYIEGVAVRELVWKNQAREAACKLRKKGLLEPSQQHGVWQISEQGRRFQDQAT